jgi:hypothetical protein
LRAGPRSISASKCSAYAAAVCTPAKMASARLYQFVTLPAGHRHSCTTVEVNAQAKLAIAESHRVLLDCGPPSRAGCGAPAVRGRGLQAGR